MGLVMVWASACLLMATRLPTSSVDNAAFAFWAAVPFVAFAGYHAVNLRLDVLRKSIDLSSSYILDMKVRLLMLDNGCNDESLARADKLYEAALTQLTASPMVHIYYAAYLQKYKKNRPMEMAQLALAERKVRGVLAWRRQGRHVARLHHVLGVRAHTGSSAG